MPCDFITLIIAEAQPDALFPIFLLLLLWLNALSVFSTAVSGTDSTCVWQITVQMHKQSLYSVVTDREHRMFHSMCE
jgi:hypothetical protein